jgi:two-component system chemotaxis response regulator CheY
MRSLIVDDDDIGRMMLAAFIEDFGICDLAENGKVALELYNNAIAEGQPYDLVCLDIIMPVMDGRSTLARIRETDKIRGSRSKVFMISACNSPKDIQGAFFEGDCDDYVVKPFHREAIMQLFERHHLI